MYNDEHLKSVDHMLDSLDSISYEAIDTAYQATVEIEQEYSKNIAHVVHDYSGMLSKATHDELQKSYFELQESLLKHADERKRPLFHLMHNICEQHNLSFNLALECMARKHRWKICIS
jgi:hypothetical protein